jgi:hypothetical protein
MANTIWNDEQPKFSFQEKTYTDMEGRTVTYYNLTDEVLDYARKVGPVVLGGRSHRNYEVHYNAASHQYMVYSPFGVLTADRENTKLYRII